MTWTSRRLIVIKVIGEALFLYGLLSWIDGVFIQFLYPAWLPMQVSHLLPWVRTDTFTIFSFFVSASGFFIWRLTDGLLKLDKAKQPDD